MSIENTGENEFNTNNNKQLLWNILNENGVFNNIKTDAERNSIQELFENTILDVTSSSMQNKLLVDKNKHFIKCMVEKMQDIKSNQYNNYNNTGINHQHRREDIHQQRKSDFEKRLSIRQKEFIEDHNKNIPKTPEFNEKMDEPLKDDMNNIISDMIKQRELDMQKIEQTQSKTEHDGNQPEWLTNGNLGNNNINDPNYSNSNSNSNYIHRHIKINENCDIIACIRI